MRASASACAYVIFHGRKTFVFRFQLWKQIFFSGIFSIASQISIRGNRTTKIKTTLLANMANIVYKFIKSIKSVSSRITLISSVDVEYVVLYALILSHFSCQAYANLEQWIRIW